MMVIILILFVIFILFLFSMRECFMDVGSLIVNLDVVLKVLEYLS